MTLEEGKRFLEGEKLPFAELRFETERDYWNNVTPWSHPTDRGQDGPVTVLRIEAPNGRRHVDLQFLKGSFLDLWFGGFGFELWEATDLRSELLYYIRQIMRGRSYCTVSVNLKRMKWAGDGYFSEEEGDSGIRAELETLYRPKTRRERLFRTRFLHEVYDWNEYHRIER